MATKCIFCNKSLKNSKRTTIKADSLARLIEISHERGDNLHEMLSEINFLQTHLVCRNKYVLSYLY